MKLKPGVAIIGCPRSGTTLLATLLERRFAYAAPVESHIVKHFHWINRCRPAAITRMAGGITRFLRAWVPFTNRRDPEASRRYSLLAVAEAGPAIAGSSRDVRDLIGGLFTAFADLHSARGWVDQSVYARPGGLGYLADYPEDTQVIHVIRDGRDVWLSWRQTWFSPAGVHQAARYWAGHIDAGRAWGARHPGRYLEVRYEDLLGQFEGTLARVGEFLGAPPLPAGEARASGLADVLVSGGTHDLIHSGPMTENRAKWKTRMQPGEQAVFERLAGAQLQACGYETGALSVTAEGALRRAVSGLVRLAGELGFNAFRRRAKYLLALYCWLRGMPR